MARVTRSLAAILRGAVLVVAHLLTAVRGQWRGSEPAPGPRVYFANHASHADFALIWTVLPPSVRARSRPVAAADYWLASPLRRFVIRDVFRAVLIDRRWRERGSPDPIECMARALDGGASLIFFPEGTRNTTDEALLPLKSGLYRLAKARPDIELVPVWIDNLNRVLPKGELLPVPLLCTVTFGAPIKLEAGETQDAFLDRARRALLSISRTTEIATCRSSTVDSNS